MYAAVAEYKLQFISGMYQTLNKVSSYGTPLRQYSSLASPMPTASTIWPVPTWTNVGSANFLKFTNLSPYGVMCSDAPESAIQYSGHFSMHWLTNAVAMDPMATLAGFEGCFGL